jgi:hypothetical protein
MLRGIGQLSNALTHEFDDALRDLPVEFSS